MDPSPARIRRRGSSRRALVRAAQALAIGTLGIVVLLSAAVVWYLKAPTYAGSTTAANTMAIAISDPRQDSAEALTRAALSASRRADFDVVEAQDIPPDPRDPGDLLAPMARLVFRFRAPDPRTLDALDFRQPPQDGCWEAVFNYYGVIGRPRHMRCPADAAALVPPPLAPEPVVRIPDGAHDAMTALLGSLPREVTTDGLLAAATRALPPLGTDPRTGLVDLPPDVDVKVDGADLAVALSEPGGCLVAARIAGTVTAGWLSPDQMRSGELGCSADTALDVHAPTDRQPPT